MLDIQDAGTQILGGCPGPFYIFGGKEYGIKCKYIDALKQHYGNIVTGESVQDVLRMITANHVVLLKPSVYVIRYDEAFVSSASKNTISQIKKIKNATVVCLYEEEKHIKKLQHVLDDYIVIIDAVSRAHMVKYLKSDYPGVPDRIISTIAEHCDNYNDAYNKVYAISQLPESRMNSLTNADILNVLGKSSAYSEESLRMCIAARDFRSCLAVIEDYSGEIDAAFYTILQTMIELDKLKDNKYTQSPLRKYADQWLRTDIYYMFMHTYEQLKASREVQYNITDGLVYLFGLLRFQKIPSPEVMNYANI